MKWSGKKNPSDFCTFTGLCIQAFSKIYTFINLYLSVSQAMSLMCLKHGCTPKLEIWKHMKNTYTQGCTTFLIYTENIFQLYRLENIWIHTNSMWSICNNHLAPVKMLCTFSDVTFDMSFQLRAQKQQLLLSQKEKQKNIDMHCIGNEIIKTPWWLCLLITNQLKTEPKQCLKPYLLISWEELKIGSFIYQGQKAVAEVVGLRQRTNIQIQCSGFKKLHLN